MIEQPEIKRVKFFAFIKHSLFVFSLRMARRIFANIKMFQGVFYAFFSEKSGLIWAAS